MAHYRITVQRYFIGPNGQDSEPETIIECDSDYRLTQALTEWVKEEIDPDATIETAD